MMNEDNKAMVVRFTEEVLNQHNLTVLDQFVVPDYNDHNRFPGLPQGIEGQRQTFRTLFDAFPDLHFEGHDIIAEGDKVVIRSTMRGTQQGAFRGVPATGKPIAVEVIDIVRMENGKLVERWGLLDALSLMQQIGALPTAPGAQPHAANPSTMAGRPTSTKNQPGAPM